MECKIIEQYGDQVGPRCGHTQFTYKNHIYVFSGSTKFSQTNNFDKKLYLYKFNPITKNWTKLKGDRFTARNYAFGAPCLIYENILFTFGGNFGGLCNSTIYTYDLDKEEQWKLIESSNRSISYCHTSVIYGTKAYFFGGKVRLDNEDEFSDFEVTNILQILDVKTLEWDIKTSEDHAPEKRFVHTSFLWDGKMYIYGGFDTQQHFGDMFYYDLNLLHWNKIEYKSIDIPSSRRSTSSIVHHDTAYIFGGFDGVNFLNDLWSFDLHNDKWKKIELQSNVMERRFHSCALIEDYNQFYVFGGFNYSVQGHILGDMIQFNINTSKKSMRSTIYNSIGKTYTDLLILTKDLIF